MLKRTFRSLTLLALTLILTGCIGGGGKTSVKYYLVDPVAAGFMEEEAERQLAIEILDLHIPQYLQRFQLVTRDGDNRIKLSDSNQWAENLRKNLLRTLASNLATRLSTIDIGTPLNRSASEPDYRLHVHITRFERNASGRVELKGRWQVANADDEDLGMHFAALEGGEVISDGDYDQVVADMQELFAEFCDRIADSIKAL